MVNRNRVSRFVLFLKGLPFCMSVRNPGMNMMIMGYKNKCLLD